MKLALAWMTLLALVIAGSCSINKRSGDYACTVQKDCAAPRVCDNGFCVVPDNVPIDAPLPNPVDGKLADAQVIPLDADLSACPAQCSSCDLQASLCRIDCAGSNAANCFAPITCPTGFNCDINCGTNGACRSGVTCTNAASCNISCSGQNSCKTVMCGAGPCNVDCSGVGSCRGVSCGASCACDIACHTAAACDGITCSGIACQTFDGGCSSSSSPLCDTCP